ncbi:hypothetical protein MAPG_08924 [Magnaporthiopsis poae ATCC 64411]|uniref:LIM zinc-binding domain-containing protein n=1 Tax=Magnaporthiopsis poae (strain ATCC 64411 / 73-15) TaxID=644358 RepID=A0A0C4E8L5_MAGP6|nr:hypothetical protein MAPG_08924 [Magnaporthiopsis poae ATCC 64411]
MAALERQSSFLPTIKCSSCGNQIEISMMGEHICGGSAEEPPMPPPPDKEKLDTFMPFNKEVHEKIGRVPPPPKVDTLAANRTYYRAGQLTPVSNSSGTASRSDSPLTPNARSLAGRSEDYFAPKIANEEDPTPQQPRQRRSGGYGGMNEFDDQMYPADTGKKQAPNLLARMNSIAPGPFDAGRRPSAASRDPPPRRPSGDDRMGDMGNPYGERPQTSNTNAGFGGGGGNQPRAPRSNGYGGFGPPQRSPDAFEPEPFGSRSRTFPRETEPAGPLLRTPSEPGSRPDQQRRPSNDMYGRQSPMGPDTSRQPPPLGTSSYNRPPTHDGSNPAPPDLTDEFGIGNPYHSPNSSLSSNGSSRPSHTSSQTSPSRSLRSGPTRKPSDTSSFDSLMQDLQSSMDDMASLGNNRDPPTPQDRTHERPRPSRNQSSSRRQNSRNDPYSQRAPSPIPSPGWDNSMDRGRDNRRPPSPRYSSPERVTETAPSRAPQRPRSGDSVPKNRGNCKACREPITGKSISSADGRLTGRYHKVCFVCTTCRDPFTSATFYVHDDMPYCEQHYHEVNGSLCGMCNIGIEGQYLADERDTKYHPPCFRCTDCGQILSDGYFEIGGRRYCERDAWRRTQPAPQPTNRVPMPSNLGPGSRRPPQAGLPGGPKGFPGNRGMGGQPYGMSGGGNNRLGAPGSRPRMEKRMTRLGMM